MPDKKPWLCDGCPGKNDPRVDLDCQGVCESRSVDSFRQARRWPIETPDDYPYDTDLASLVAEGLLYFDEETGEYVEVTGDYKSAMLGALCARRFLRGECPKTRGEILAESELD